MRLLCVSHPCVTPPNQDFYARVAARSGWELTIVLPQRWRTEYGPARAERWPAFHGRLVALPVLGAGNVPLHVYARSLRRVVERERSDAVYAHHEPYGLATYQTFRAARDLPSGFYSAQNLVKRYPWPVRALERWVYARASFALPVSETVADVLRAKGYRGPLEVLPLAVPTSELEPGRNGRRDGFTVGFVGRLAREKGVDVLLDALARLPAGRVRAVVAGDGPEAEPLRRRAEALALGERVRWLGYVRHDEVGGVYEGLDALVVPSRSVPGWREQFGRVVVEALARGVPVVASDSGELPRLLAETGGGWTFPEGDAAALARIVESLLADPDAARERGREGRRAVRERFDADDVADRFVAVVAAAVERAGGRP